MKKLLVFFCVFALAGGFAAAQDLGLSVGLELGVENVTKANDGDMVPYVSPMVIYENSLFNGILDIYTELDYTFQLTDIDDKEITQDLYFNIGLGFNLSLGKASTLTFLVENENELAVFPDAGYEQFTDRLTGLVKPGIRFTQDLADIGGIFAQVDVPVAYFPWNDDPAVGLEASLGWDSVSGLGFMAKGLMALLPKDDLDFLGVEIVISFENNAFYAELEMDIPKEINLDGLTFIPEIEYTFGKLTLYAYCEIDGIGIKDSDIGISPALGVKFNF